MEMIIQNWLALGNNCTIVLSDHLGDYNSKTGLIGTVATNETDCLPYFFGPYEIPDAEYLLIFAIDYVFLSAYNYTHDMRDGNLLHTYLSFDWSYYVSVVVSMMVFIFTWNMCASTAGHVNKKLKRQVKNARKGGVYLIFCDMLNQHQYPNISRMGFTVISTSASVLFFFLVDCFMMSMISTDLVVITEPRVIRTYDDIIDNDVKIWVFKGTSEESLFRDLSLGIDERFGNENSEKMRKVASNAKLYKSFRTIFYPDAQKDVINQKMIHFWWDDAIGMISDSFISSANDDNFRILLTKANLVTINSFIVNRLSSPAFKDFIVRK